MLLPRLHASTRRDEPLTTLHATGEVRVPLALYEVDERRADVDLVLSRTEAHRLFTQLVDALGLGHHVPAQRGLEAVR